MTRRKTRPPNIRRVDGHCVIVGYSATHGSSPYLEDRPGVRRRQQAKTSHARIMKDGERSAWQTVIAVSPRPSALSWCRNMGAGRIE